MFLFSPETFSLPKEVEGENVYIQAGVALNKEKADKQHRTLCRILKAKACPVNATDLPDIVFAANAGLALPRLPVPVVLLSSMKHKHRQRETPLFDRAMREKGILTVPFPTGAVFEGQGEGMWFLNGKLLVLGYGFRSTRRTLTLLRSVIQQVYNHFKVEPPIVIGLKLKSPRFYHIDLVMAKTSERSCAMQWGSVENVQELREYIDVRAYRTHDPFLFNLVTLSDKVVTHKLESNKDRAFLESVFGKPVVEVDVSEFEKSGGSVGCMVFKEHKV
jgi:N-dimethylarginine dimethylaminohydrolase